MTATNDPMAEIRALFFIECDELLESLQDGLQAIDNDTDDTETIHVVFRAVHSIKGGAGAFGLDCLVRFAHRFETVLDDVRAGQMVAGPNVLKVFFQAADHLSDLVRCCRDDAEPPEGVSDSLLAALDTLLGDRAQPSNGAEDTIEFQPQPLSLNLGPDDVGSAAPVDFSALPDISDMPDLPSLPEAAAPFDPSVPVAKRQDLNTFNIHFAPSSDLFETGNEPFYLLRNLRELGKCKVTLDRSRLPAFKELTPDSCYLAWNVVLQTQADASEIASTFEFVEGLCTLEIRGDDARLHQASDPVALPEPAVSLQDDVAPEAPLPLTDTPVPSADPDVTPMARKTSQPAPAKSVVRVDLERIERLVNLVGELVINQAMLSQSLEQSGLSPHSDAMNGLEEFQRLTRDIQDSVMMIRAQPVKSLFQRMSRIVREASAAVGKDVRLRTDGDTTEVDKTVIERLADPLTHMIRNAVDHGLESTEEREKAGKPREGTVTLSAAHRSGRVLIEIADDGGGIDRARVRKTAIDKGLIPADAQLSDTEIDNLLFLPGFSTVSVVSDLSGRGVGMDVVRTAIQALGGRITITSTPGVGTTFSISLPLTLAVLDGMVVQVAGETMVLPLNVVIEAITLSGTEVQQVRPGSHVVLVRGEFVPLFDLGVELGYREPQNSFDNAVVLLILHEDGHCAALIIDSIQDQRQVVIKGLDDSFHRAPGIAAATILGDGQIALILDPTDIISNAMSHRRNLQLSTGT